MKMSKIVRGLSPAMTLILASACATIAPNSPSINAAQKAPGTQTITGDQIVQSGRTNTADALRALSPLFH